MMDDFWYISRHKDALTNFLIKAREKKFYELWKKDCLPWLLEKSNQLVDGLNSIDVSSICDDIMAIKKINELDDIQIFISYFTFPTSFMLSSHSYVTSERYNEKINSIETLTILAHELCHGFANEKSTNAYLNLIKQDDYLSQTHDYLINLGSGNEEEFVVALEKLISYRNKLQTLDEIYTDLESHYGSCMPIAIILFDKLKDLKEIPDDINNWISIFLTDVGVFDRTIKEIVDSIIPGYSSKIIESINRRDKK